MLFLRHRHKNHPLEFTFSEGGFWTVFLYLVVNDTCSPHICPIAPPIHTLLFTANLILTTFYGYHLSKN